VMAPPPPVEGALTVDASRGWAFVSFGDGAVVTPTPSSGESAAWDIAFSATSVMLNGGAAGPGGATGACICQNTGATGAEILAMTADSERPDYDAVTAVPAGAAFVSEALTPVITGWFTGVGAAATADPSKTFLVRLADSTSFAKLRVVAIEGATSISAGRVTFEYAVQPAADAAFEATRSVVLDLTTGAKAIDLNTGTIAATVTGWDLRAEGFVIRVNGGASGPGKAAATPGSGGFESITTASIQANAYKTDTYAGIFASKPWYRYNLAGDNRISPTFDVYLVRRGTTTYALQLVNYYSVAGAPRHITFRYKQI
jgi:hypothetical protein